MRPVTPPTTKPVAPTPSPIQPNVFCCDEPGAASGEAGVVDVVRLASVLVVGVAIATPAEAGPGSSASVTAVDSPSFTSIVLVAGL